jgi:hypothetical protein
MRSAPGPDLDPNVLEAIRRLGVEGAPLGNPLMRGTVKGDWTLPSYPAGQTPPISGRGPVQTVPGGLIGNLPAAAVPLKNGQPATAGWGSLADMVTQPPAPQPPSSGQGLGSLFPSRTGQDWGDEPPEMAPLPSGRMADSFVDPARLKVDVPNISPPHIKPRFFDKNGAWRDTLGTLLDGLAVAAGGQAGYWPGVQKNREWQAKQKRQEAEDAFEREKFAWQKKKDSRPEVRAVGRSIVSLPFEGLPKVVFSAPSDAESYAASLGLKEGDEGYSDAIMDYVLKSSGPTAYSNRMTLEDLRSGNRQELKGTPTYRDLHPRPAAPSRGSGSRPPRGTGEVVAPILAKLARGEKLTPGETQALGMYRGGGRRGGGSLPGPTKPAPRPRPAPAPAAASGPVRVRTPDEARALPPGTVFITPDGRRKVR